MSNTEVAVQGESAKGGSIDSDGLNETTRISRIEQGYFWLAFLVGNTGYAINAKYVARIIVLREIVPFAEAPAHCPGIIWDREGMIRLIDLRSLFGKEDCLSAIKNEKSKLPMVMVIGLNGERRGMIVDKIISMEHFKDFTESLPEQDSEQTKYICGMVKCNLLKAPTLVISPDSFSEVKFEDPDTKIDWGGRFDIQLKINDSL